MTNMSKVKISDLRKQPGPKRTSAEIDAEIRSLRQEWEDRFERIFGEYAYLTLEHTIEQISAAVEAWIEGHLGAIGLTCTFHPRLVLETGWSIKYTRQDDGRWGYLHTWTLLKDDRTIDEFKIHTNAIL